MTRRLALVVLILAAAVDATRAQSPAPAVPSPAPRAAATAKPALLAPPVFEGTVTGPDGKPVAEKPAKEKADVLPMPEKKKA